MADQYVVVSVGGPKTLRDGSNKSNSKDDFTTEPLGYILQPALGTTWPRGVFQRYSYIIGL